MMSLPALASRGPSASARVARGNSHASAGHRGWPGALHPGVRAEAVRVRGCAFTRIGTAMPSRGGVRPVGATPADDAAEAEETDAFRQQLMASAGAADEVEGGTMTGEELREIVMARWGRPYDTRICQRRDRFNRLRLYVQVMWKFLGQKTFPLTEQQYNDQLEAVADLLTEWGVADKVREDIANCAKNPVLDTTGANAVMIPLDVEADVRL